MDCKPAGPDPTGELVGGYVVLRGVLVSSGLRYRKTDSKATLNSLYTLDALEKSGKSGIVTADYDSSIEEPGGDGAVMIAYCFLVGRKSSGPGHELCYLLLRCVGEDTNLGCKVYERIGSLEVLAGIGVDGEETVVKIV